MLQNPAVAWKPTWKQSFADWLQVVETQEDTENVSLWVPPFNFIFDETGYLRLSLLILK